MFQKLISLKIVVILLLVFVSQVTVTTAIACEMMAMQQTQMNEHSGHQMANHDVHSSSESMESCCEQSGNCSMSGCIVFAFSTMIIDSELHLISDPIISKLNNTPSQTSNSLFRPPILS